MALAQLVNWRRGKIANTRPKLVFPVVEVLKPCTFVDPFRCDAETSTRFPCAINTTSSETSESDGVASTY